MPALTGKDIVFGVTGGIAAYKSCEAVSRLVKEGANVFVVMTENACRFVSPLTFQTLSKNRVSCDTFEKVDAWDVHHISLAKRASLFVVAPATANCLAKIAGGIADDMLTTTLLACKAPLLLAPAMNTGMWNAAATQANVETLKARGVHFVGPEGGLLACGDTGSGRMSEAVDIVNACKALLNQDRDLEGLRILVTAGPTAENLDPVRYITNYSSGKMGYAIATAAAKRGADVTLVTGPVHIPRPAVQVVQIRTTDDLLREVTLRASEQDIIIQAAAPADFKPLAVSDSKIKKQGDAGMTLELVKTPDVARAVGQMKRPGQVLVGFAAETDRLIEHARQKLSAKNLDLIVANDVTQEGAGFDVDTNIVTFLTADETEALPLLSKQEVADRLLSRVLTLRKGRG